jgi:hypothetical protein
LSGIKLIGQSFRQLPDQRLGHYGAVITRHDMNAHSASGQIAPAQSLIHCQLGQRQLNRCAKKSEWNI